MSKFKVGDRVRAVVETVILVKGREYTVVAPTGIGPAHHVFVNTGFNGVLNYTDDFFELVEPVAVAPATATLKVGDYVVGKSNIGSDVSGPIEVVDAGAKQPYRVDGLWCWEHDVKLAEPATPIAVTLGVDINPPLPPQVGDDVLIFGTIAAINHSPRGTNYNIVFETQNRRMSLHFLEEDFIVDPEQGYGDCPCANDNGPVPSADTVKAFDAMGAWLRSLAVSRAA